MPLTLHEATIAAARLSRESVAPKWSHLTTEKQWSEKRCCGLESSRGSPSNRDVRLLGYACNRPLPEFALLEQKRPFQCNSLERRHETISLAMREQQIVSPSRQTLPFSTIRSKSSPPVTLVSGACEKRAERADKWTRSS